MRNESHEEGIPEAPSGSVGHDVFADAGAAIQQLA
jgi:hypothetical protein